MIVAGCRGVAVEESLLTFEWVESNFAMLVVYQYLQQYYNLVL